MADGHISGAAKPLLAARLRLAKTPLLSAPADKPKSGGLTSTEVGASRSCKATADTGTSAQHLHSAAGLAIRHADLDLL